jgi:hypothetical protein
LPKKTFEAAAEAQAHLIVQLKDNQPTLCRKVEAVCNDTKPLSCVQTVDTKKRNRHESRTVAVFNARPAVAETEWQPHVADAPNKDGRPSDLKWALESHGEGFAPGEMVPTQAE